MRIRREEVTRFHEAVSSGRPSTYDQSFISDSQTSIRGESSASSLQPPSNADTFRVVMERLGRVNPREWNWRGFVDTTQKKRWGIVDEPGEK